MRVLRIAILALLIGALCTASYAAKKKGKGRKPMLSCDTYSLRNDFNAGKLDYLTAPKALKEIGITGITYNEIWMKSYDNDYLDSIKKACADAGVKITGFIIEGSLAMADDEARKKQIEHDIKLLKAAAYLGAPVVRINIGGAGSEEQDGTVGVQRCIDAFNQMLPIAKELKVKLTIENHGGVSKTADMILRIIKGTDPKWVGSCLDFGNWPGEPKELRYTESAKLAPYAYHVHAKCHEFTPEGEDANKDYKRLLQMLKDAHYKYAVSIEFEGGGDQMEGVKKTRTLLLKYWPELAK